MKKYLALTLSIAATINANYIIVNNSGQRLVFRQVNMNDRRTRIYKVPPVDVRLAPGDMFEVDIREANTWPHSLNALYYASVNPAEFEKSRKIVTSYLLNTDPTGKISDERYVMFPIPDNEYGIIIKKAKSYLPIITITNDPKTNKPVINAPADTKALQAQIAQIKQEKQAPVIRETARATGLPNEEGAIAGIVSGYTEEEA